MLRCNARFRIAQWVLIMTTEGDNRRAATASG